MASTVRERGPSAPPVVLTEAEVASVLRVTGRTVRRWAAAGTLDAIKVGGIRRYRVDQVVGLIERASVQEPAGEVAPTTTDT